MFQIIILFGLSPLIKYGISFVISPRITPLSIRRQEQRSNFLQYSTTTSSNQDGDDFFFPNSESSSNHRKYNISLLLIDHYDSFTYNLYDMFAQLTINPPTVIAKDAYEGWNDDDILTDLLENGVGGLDGIILSPGPGSPQEQPLLSKQAIRNNPDLPILGVCLGHQLLALEYGASVDKAPMPIHGQDHWIRQTNHRNSNSTSSHKSSLAATKGQSKLWTGLPATFRVVRYHSLAAYDLPSDCLTVTAKSKGDGVIQGIEHTTNPHYGVQFHPESIGTQHGMALLENFCQIVQKQKEAKNTPHIQEQPVVNGERLKVELEYSSATMSNSIGATSHANGRQQKKTGNLKEVSKSRFQVLVHALPPGNEQPQPVDVFDQCYSSKPYAMWLDSSSYPNRGTIDILAAPSTKDDILEYRIIDENGEQQHTDILTILEQELFGNEFSPADEIAIVNDVSVVPPKSSLSFVKDSNLTNPPFEYRGGYLGFLGYEVRHDTHRFLQHQEHGKIMTEKPKLRSSHGDSTVPNAAFFLARRSMVFHHPTQQWYLVGLVETGKEEPYGILKWMQSTTDQLITMIPEKNRGEDASIRYDEPTRKNSTTPLAFVPNRLKKNYEQDIKSCHESIRIGDSYELCLTNQLEAKTSASWSTWDLYQTLRRRNPAPYSAYFRWNSDQLTICCSSPERFMGLRRRQELSLPEAPVTLQAEAKPIKGTCARVLPHNGISRTDCEAREDERRARSLELSLKNRAENLMIVDLLRNDMSRVCEVGSVHVAKLMAIESFTTVHQMVSTIRGTLSKDATPIDLLRASFPGGSMTGAPKIRTMELLEGLEDDVDRGPYSGSLGYLSVNGCMDMNIIIRSAVVTPTRDGGQKISVGAGGAITALSETEDEYEEMLLKARAVVQAVQEWAALASQEESIPEYSLKKSSESNHDRVSNKIFLSNKK